MSTEPIALSTVPAEPTVLVAVRDAVKTLIDQLAVKGVPIDDTMQDAIDRLTAATAGIPE